MSHTRYLRPAGALISSDIAFHEAVWQFSGNETLERALRVACPPLFAFYLVNFRTPEPLSNDLLTDAEEHARGAEKP